MPIVIICLPRSRKTLPFLRSVGPMSLRSLRLWILRISKRRCCCILPAMLIYRWGAGPNCAIYIMKKLPRSWPLILTGFGAQVLFPQMIVRLSLQNYSILRISAYRSFRWRRVTTACISTMNDFSRYMNSRVRIASLSIFIRRSSLR